MYRVRLLMKESAALRLAVQDARDGQSEELRESMVSPVVNSGPIIGPSTGLSLRQERVRHMSL